MNAIELKKVSRSFIDAGQERFALKDISLSINEGEFLCTCGPSGSGKTTLLNLIAGLDVPTSGKVISKGIEIQDLSQSERAAYRLSTVGFVFQSYNLIPVLSAEENVAFILQLQGVSFKDRSDRARELLSSVGLSGLEARRPHELSGGQQQRVAIARALASRPAFILADEPTANLDSTTSRQLLSLMENLHEKQGMTFIFSTHDDLVMSFARRLIHLKDGVLVEDEVR